jgi:hypothetical protein
MEKKNKSSSLKRLSRIEGQVRGLARMVEEEPVLPRDKVAMGNASFTRNRKGQGIQARS